MNGVSQSPSLVAADVRVFDLNSYEPDFRTLVFVGASTGSLSIEYYDAEGRIVTMRDAGDTANIPVPFLPSAITTARSLRAIAIENGGWGTVEAVAGVPSAAVGVVIRCTSGAVCWNYQRRITDVHDAAIVNPPTTNSPNLMVAGQTMYIGRVPGAGIR
jgi:hypothetical protein